MGFPFGIYLITLLLDRIFPKEPIDADIQFLRRTQQLQWLTLEHLSVNPQYKIEELFEYAIKSWLFTLPEQKKLTNLPSLFSFLEDGYSVHSCRKIGHRTGMFKINL